MTGTTKAPCEAPAVKSGREAALLATFDVNYYERADKKNMNYENVKLMPKQRNRLRELRLAKGLTQVDLAGRVGVKASTLARWDEMASARLPLDAALRLADALEVSPSELLFTI
jgi:DNA-binding XRE family transcriptional regulator